MRTLTIPLVLAFSSVAFADSRDDLARSIEDYLAHTSQKEIEFNRRVEVTATFTSSFVSKYVNILGIELGKASVQNDLTVSFGDWYVNLWVSSGSSTDKNGGGEIDYELGRIWQTHFGKIRFKAAYFDLNPLMHAEGDIIQPSLTVFFRIDTHDSRHTLWFSLRADHSFVVSQSKNNGWAFHTNLTHTWDIGHDLTLNQTIELTYNIDGFLLEDTPILKYLVKLAWRIDERAVVGPGIKASTPLAATSDGRETEVAFIVSFSFSF